MAESDGQDRGRAGREWRWSKAEVLIAGVGVASSLGVSLLVSQSAIQSAEEQRRVDALSQYQSSLTRYSASVAALADAYYTFNRAVVDWHMHVETSKFASNVELDESKRPPIPEVTSAAHAASTAALDLLADYDKAAYYFKDTPRVRACAEQVQQDAKDLVRLSGKDDVLLTDIDTMMPIAKDLNNLDRLAVLDDLHGAVGRARDENLDSPEVCIAFTDASEKSGEKPQVIQNESSLFSPDSTWFSPFSPLVQP